MVTWGEFREENPELARLGQGLFYQFGVGLAFIATVRSDGGPRLHPFCPLVTSAGIWGLLLPSPKRDDLHRDGRYAIHSFPADDNEDAFYVTGQGRYVSDDSVMSQVENQFMTERELTSRPSSFDSHQLFEFLIERCLYTSTKGHGDPAPEHTVWASPGTL